MILNLWYHRIFIILDTNVNIKLIEIQYNVKQKLCLMCTNMPFCVCVCIVLCNVYWCELMLDSKCYWMRNNIWKKWMNEWMNEWMMHLYSAFLCIAVHPKRFTIMWGGFSPQPPPVCSIHLGFIEIPTIKINNQWWNKDKKLIASNRTKTYINKKRDIHCVN